MELPDRLGADGIETIKEVDWEDTADAGARWQGAVQADLIMGQVIPVGTDEIRYDYRSGTDRNVPTYTGHRHFVVTVRVTTDSQAPGSAAVGEVSSRLRIRFRAERVQALLRAGRAALVSIYPTSPVYQIDINGRVQSVATTDILLATTEEWTDEDATGDYIATAEGNGTLTAPGGAEAEADFDTSDLP